MMDLRRWTYAGSSEEFMANHKRGKRKNCRAGCLMCKPWKMNGAKKELKLKPSERRKLQKE